MPDCWVFTCIGPRGADIINLQVFRKADANAIDLISKLLEYTPTQRLSAIDAMVHPFFDELRDPNTRLPDSRHANGATKDLPVLFDFTLHGTITSIYRIVIRLLMKT